MSEPRGRPRRDTGGEDGAEQPNRHDDDTSGPRQSASKPVPLFVDERPWSPDPAVGGRGLDEGRRRRDDGARAAELNTFGPWKLAAERALADLAASGREWTSDDLLERVGLPIASSRNTVGAVIQAAVKRGDIEPVGYTQSTRPSAHGRVIRVWRGRGRERPS